MPRPARKYLDFMGAYWSCSPEAFDKIMAAFEQKAIVELTGMDVFMLKRKPRGQITKFRVDLRHE